MSVLERRGRKEVSGKVVEIEKTAPQRETISSLVGTEEQKQQIEREIHRLDGKTIPDG